MADRRSALSDWMTIINFACWVGGGIWFVIHLMEPQVGLPSLFGLARVQAVLVIGLAAAAAHGILWTKIEGISGWDHGSGGGESLPEGWSAVVQSATITIPLAAFPPLYGYLFHEPIVPRGHALASCCMIAAAAVGHLVLYGVKSLKIPGLKRMIYPLNSPANLRRALKMELIYAVIHFSSIVLTYRLALQFQGVQSSTNPFLSALISASLWLMGVSVFILLRFPKSLIEKRSIELRGLINGLMLLITLQGGMMM